MGKQRITCSSALHWTQQESGRPIVFTYAQRWGSGTSAGHPPERSLAPTRLLRAALLFRQHPQVASYGSIECLAIHTILARTYIRAILHGSISSALCSLNYIARGSP